jgi:hypothetical protein
MGDSIMSHNNNPVVRSLVVEAGIVNAYADGMIRLWPRLGQARNVKLPETSTCLLALIGPQGKVWRVAVGDCSGTITLLSIPELNVLECWKLHHAPITALCVDDSRISERGMISGDAEGEIRLIGDDIDSKASLLTRIRSRPTSLRVINDEIIVMSGWKMMTLNRTKTNQVTIKAPAARWVQTTLPAIANSVPGRLGGQPMAGRRRLRPAIR